MIALAALLAIAAPAGQTPACLPITARDGAPITLTGRLEPHVYPGPPNYGEGPHDRPEWAYILIIDRPLRITESGDNGIPCAPFRRVHLYPGQNMPWSRLQAAVGHRIRVRGYGSGPATAHDRAPLVLEVSAIGRISR